MPFDVTGATDPEVARVRVRMQPYRNAIVERETIRAVDEAVFDKVREHEKSIYAAYQEFRDQDAVLRAEAEAVIAELEQLQGDVDRRKVQPDRDTAQRFVDLQREAERLSDELDRANRQAEWHANKLDDPMGAMTELIRRFPALARGIRLS